MSNLNTPAIYTGPLTAGDLDTATNTGRILPHGCDQQGRYQTRPWPAEACTEVGHDDADPKATATFWTAYAALLLAVSAASAVAYFF